MAVFAVCISSIPAAQSWGIGFQSTWENSAMTVLMRPMTSNSGNVTANQSFRYHGRAGICCRSVRKT